MGWDAARKLLAATVTKHLGEDLTLTEDGGPGSAQLRGVLTRPEEVVRLGLTTVIAGAAMLTVRKSDAPEWFDRGTVVTSAASGEVYEVTQVTDNGEGLLEVTLCRSS